VCKRKRKKWEKEKENINRDWEINQRDLPHPENQGRLGKKSK